MLPALHQIMAAEPNRKIIPDMPEFSLSLAEELLQELDKQEGRTEEAIANHKESIDKLKKLRWHIHAQKGEILAEVQKICHKRSWGKWLKSAGIDRSHAYRLILVSKDPDGTWQRSGGDLSRVAIGNRNVAAAATNLQAVISAIEKAKECLENPSLTCAVCEAIRELDGAIHDLPDRACADCETHREGQTEVEASVKRQYLSEHPVWPWVKKLVVRRGKNRGEVQSDDWAKRKHGFTLDRIAQQLGYERGEVPPVGLLPRDYELMPSERFKLDLREAYRLSRELKRG